VLVAVTLITSTRSLVLRDTLVAASSPAVASQEATPSLVDLVTLAVVSSLGSRMAVVATPSLVSSVPLYYLLTSGGGAYSTQPASITRILPVKTFLTFKAFNAKAAQGKVDQFKVEVGKFW